MKRLKITEMAYGSSAELVFGTARKPVSTKRGLVIGGGHVHPEVKPHPRPGSEKTLRTLMREYERANGDILERMVIIGHPAVQIENEHIYQMTNNPKWGAEIASQAGRQMDDHHRRYGLKSSYRATVADLRKPDMYHLRESDATAKVLEAFDECAKYADILSIESLGGKEVFDHSIIRNDIVGLLFAIGVLGALDMEWLWTRIVEISRRNGCIAGGDTNCSQANTAMFMAGGMISKDVPHVIAALCRAMSAANSLIAYECGATGPAKDCAYENPIIKAITGIPIATEGKTSACAHSDLCGNLMMAVCDLWSNEAVEYHDMFGATTPSVFAEILGYDCAMLNSAIELGYQRQMQEILVNSDMYRDSHSLILAPDNAWQIGRVIASNRNNGDYACARIAAVKAGEIILSDPLMRLTAHEKEALLKAVVELESLPDDEGDFIDRCLHKYRQVKGFNPASYGL
ncbi:MAG: methyltransferase MtaB domain-containing protein [Pseudomonadota bacterium]